MGALYTKLVVNQISTIFYSLSFFAILSELS